MIDLLRTGVLVTGACLAITHGQAEASPRQAKSPVQIEQDVVYGTGQINASTVPRPRDLRMDTYLPESKTPVPAVIMVFGGAFHRGEKGDVHFSENGAQDSSMADYCQVISTHGYACFAIEYRLTPESPALPGQVAKAVTVPKSVMQDETAMARINLVRRRMGLEKLDETSREQYWAATFAAAEDLETALRHIRDNSDVYNVNPEHIALGGFSAGAMTVMNVAYGRKADVSGVISLSGGVWGYNILKNSAAGDPPLLMFAGQNDLPGILWGSGEISKTFQKKGIETETAWVSGFGHFYPMGSVSLGPDYTRQTVQGRFLSFLDKLFNRDTVTSN